MSAQPPRSALSSSCPKGPSERECGVSKRTRRWRRSTDDGACGRQGAREAARGAGRSGAADRRGPLRILALDYGVARTGVAVSDETETIASPLTVVQRATSPAGLEEIRSLVEVERAELVVVGLPLTLRGERGRQAEETEDFVRVLRAALDVPV